MTKLHNLFVVLLMSGRLSAVWKNCWAPAGMRIARSPAKAGSTAGISGAEAMITVKHLMDAVEKEDGNRIWVEPIGLTLDLKKWCKVSHTLCHVAPPRDLWDWFADHPEGYEFFRGRYHEWLRQSPYRSALQQLACAATRENITLLHQSEDARHNSATALYEFLSELEAYCPPE